MLFYEKFILSITEKQIATKIKSLLQAAATLLVAAATSNLVEVSAYPRGCFMSSFIKILQILFEIKLFATKFHQKCCILQQPNGLSMPRPFQNDRAGQNTPSCQISYFLPEVKPTLYIGTQPTKLWGPRQPLNDQSQAASGSEWFEEEPGAQNRLLGALRGS